MTGLSIGNRPIGPGHEPFLVLEAGINHNGRLELALDMIRVAKEAGADAIKFQTFRAHEIISDPNLTYTYSSQGQQVTESMLEVFRRYELEVEDWQRIKQACEQAGITFLSTPQNPSDLELLLKVGVPAVKVGSDDFTNLPLLARYAQAGLPLILSCGMADAEEIKRSLATVGWANGFPTVLLVCTSQYPTPPSDANLRRIATLRADYPGLVVGFSDHTQGSTAAIAAAALGAHVFEKHFTLDRALPGPDHWFSADPAEAGQWVAAIRDAHRMLGSGALSPTAAEVEMRVLARRSVVALQDITAGEVLSETNLGLRRPGDGIPAASLPTLLGRRATREIRKGQQLSLEDVR